MYSHTQQVIQNSLKKINFNPQGDKPMKKNAALVIVLKCITCLLVPAINGTAAIPLIVNHQGRISVNDTAFEGIGAFRFALVDSASGLNLWTNDGSGIGTSQPPVAPVSLVVSEGVYNVGLGNTSVPGMAALASDTFNTAGVVLRIWFDDGVNGSQYLTPDQALNSTAYAFHALKAEDADTVDGVHGSELQDAIEAHAENTTAHVNIELDAARIITGTVDLARLPQGPGSGLNADLLDGQHAGAFVSAGADNWVNTNGDTMTGRLIINAAISSPLIEATNETNTAIQGETDGISGNAIRGLSNGIQGKGIYGEATSITNHINYGGYFIAKGYQARGVYGQASSAETYTKYGGYFSASGGNGVGCRGEADGSNGKGVYGYATNEGTEETNYGGYFIAKGGEGYGVYSSGKKYGVYSLGATGGYDFYAAGGGTNYGPFTGGHEVRIAPDSPPLSPGMVVSVTGAVTMRSDEMGAPSLSSNMPEITASTTPNDPAVFGVFVTESRLNEEHWYKAKADDRFGVVNALGEGRVWVCDANGPVRVGDYITTSAVPGYAQRQDDDLLHNYTLGKVIEAVNWDTVPESIPSGDGTYKVYLIAVVYTSG